MTSEKTSKPESSVTVPPGNQPFDKLYWLRIGLAILAGISANAVFRTDFFDGVSVGILFYLLSYYFARFIWYKKLDKTGLGKIYTTGIGGYTMVFLFTWILLFTLSSA